MENKNYPLVIVFYLDAETMAIREIMQPFVDSVNEMISRKNSNVLAFFLPTTGEERVEVLNPTVIPLVDMEKINKIIEDIKTNFAIGEDIDVPDTEIELNDEDTD